jgi:zinc protease
MLMVKALQCALSYYRLYGVQEMNDVGASRRPVLALVVMACLALFTAPGRGLAQEAQAAQVPGPKKGVTIEGITEYRLDNGVRVLLFPDDSTSTVTVNLTVYVGSRHEGYGETGMAHLLEHMVFKGTPRHRDIPKLLKEHGARFNGTTWVDRTNYFETMPSTDANLEFAIRLEADRLVNSFVKREDLVSEMTVVRNEFEMGENNPDVILSQRMMAAAYEWHNYGKSTIGNRSDIERVPIDKLQAFYRKFYQPDNVMLVVAGKFEPARALEYIGKYFGVLKRPSRKLDDTYTEEPAQDGERSVVLRRVGKIGVVGAIYHIPAGAHPDFPAVEVLNQVLVSEPSGRLYKALVESKKATSVSGDASGRHDPGVIEISASVDPRGNLEAARDTMIGVLEKLGTEEITQEEVDRAKRRILTNRKLLMKDSNRIGVTLSDWGAKGDWRLFFLHRDRVAKVTPADVTRVAAAYLKQSNRTLGLFIPTEKPVRSPIPPTPDVLAMVKDLKGSETVAAGEAFDPTPENIEKRVKRTGLASGVKVALLPRKTRGNAVVATLSLRYGNEKSLKGLTDTADFMGELMLRGTKSHTRQQIKDELDKLSARISVGGQLGLLTFTVVTERDNLPGALKLLGEILREPAFPQKEFDIMKREQLNAVEKQVVEPIPLAITRLRRRLNPYNKDDIRYVPTLEEEVERLKAVTREQVVKLYEEQLSGQAGELAVVGDFDPEATVKQIETILSGWKSSVSYQRIPRPAKTDIKGGQEVINTPDKANAVYVAGVSLALKDTDPDYPALRIASYLLGEGPLSSRLADRVRKKEGLSYGVGSRFNAHPIDKAAQLMVFAITNPANIGKVDRAIMEEVQKLVKDGTNETELAEAKKSFLAARKQQRSSDRGLAEALANDLFLGRTFAHTAAFEKKIAGLNPDEVSGAFQKHISPKNLVIVHGGDFTKKAQPSDEKPGKKKEK